jgi:hypothetical protein
MENSQKSITILENLWTILENLWTIRRQLLIHKLTTRLATAELVSMLCLGPAVNNPLRSASRKRLLGARSGGCGANS